jgi:hypothetical protein
MAGLIWLMIESSGEYYNYPSGSIRRWEIPEYLRDWWLLKDSDPS